MDNRIPVPCILYTRAVHYIYSVRMYLVPVPRVDAAKRDLGAVHGSETLEGQTCYVI